MSEHQDSSQEYTVYLPARQWVYYSIAINLVCLFFIVGLSWAVFSTPNELVLQIFVVIACLCVLGLAIIHNGFYGKVRLVISPEGIFYRGTGYAIYAPWKYVRVIGKAFYGIYEVDGLCLHPILAQEQADIHAKARQMSAMTVSSWLRRGERLLPVAEALALHHIPDSIRISDYSEAIPIGAFATGNWQASKLGMEIRRYAPQAFGKGHKQGGDAPKSLKRRR